MVMVVPNVVGLLSSNKETVYIQDAKKLVNIAKAKVSDRRDFTPPTVEDHCVFLGLGYLDNSEFENPPNGGCYDVNSSFVIVKLEGHEYKYYVQLVEFSESFKKVSGIRKPTLYTDINNQTIKETVPPAEIKRINYVIDTSTLSDPVKKVFGIDDICSWNNIDSILVKNGPRRYKEDIYGVCAHP